ncbi:MAG: tetratricopeptide repeat protein [Actinobacteria bacterium]|nr:tetratricopeptide repeat protein [Actinomycetota bacterium]
MIPAKKYELTEEDFEKFRKLINQTSGIFFDRGKRDLLRLGLSDRADEIGVDTLSDYYERLTSVPEREVELRRLLDHLSVQETQFFRNQPQFDALRKYVIPEIVRRKADGYRSLRFWSAGCSTGQEPYSLAMSLLDVLPDPDSWNIQILGTDLSESALATAQRGWYAERRLNGMDRLHREKYFRQSDGGYRVVEPVRRMVHFVRHNMVTDPLPISIFGTCDIVFCRNVIIYFTHETAKYVIEHFFDILNPGGYLFLGHSETLWKMSAKYSLVEMGDAFIYNKPLPRSLEGRRFIPDRRLRDAPLPPGVTADRRLSEERRDARSEADLIDDPQAEPVTAEDGQERTDPLVSKARTSIDLGENDKAVELLLDAIKRNGDTAEAHFLLGIAYERKNDLEMAAESFRRTIYCDNTHGLAYFHLANTLERLGSFKGAVKEYRNAVKALKDDPPGRWEIDLDAFDGEALVNLCEWKVENLGSMET